MGGGKSTKVLRLAKHNVGKRKTTAIGGADAPFALPIYTPLIKFNIGLGKIGTQKKVL